MAEETYNDDLQDAEEEKKVYIKTPVSILFEYTVAIKAEIKYIYEEKKSELNLLFKCIAKIPNINLTTSSTAKSKKLAKHKASKEMLIQLAKDRLEVKFLLKKYNLNEFMKELDYKEENMNEKYMSTLMDYCVMKKLNKPKYIVNDLDGEENQKSFVVQCIVGEYETKSIGKNTKVVKHACAKEMIDLLLKVEHNEKNNNSEIKAVKSSVINQDQDCTRTTNLCENCMKSYGIKHTLNKNDTEHSRNDTGINQIDPVDKSNAQRSSHNVNVPNKELEKEFMKLSVINKDTIHSKSSIKMVDTRNCRQDTENSLNDIKEIEDTLGLSLNVDVGVLPNRKKIVKTPVSLLQEYLSLLDNVQIDFKFVNVEDTISFKILDIKCQINLSIGNQTYKSEAIEKNKQLAKQIAAKNILFELSKIIPKVKRMIVNHDIDEPVERLKSKPKHTDCETLIRVCAYNLLALPIFTPIGETGLSHSKTFTCLCQVGEEKVEGSSSTKSGAKHDSARRMMALLNRKEQLEIVIPDQFKFQYDREENLKEKALIKSILSEQYISSVSSSIQSSKLKLSKIHLSLYKSINIMSIMTNIQNKYENPMIFLQFIKNANLLQLREVIEVIKTNENCKLQIIYLPLTKIKNNIQNQLEDAVEINVVNSNVSSADSNIASANSNTRSTDSNTELELVSKKSSDSCDLELPMTVYFASCRYFISSIPLTVSFSWFHENIEICEKQILKLLIQYLVHLSNSKDKIS